MQLEILKKGQGTWARVAAYVFCGALVLFGAVRFFATFNDPGVTPLVRGLPLLGDVNWFKVAAVVVFLLGMLAVHLMLNRPRAVDALIDTEGELRKVSWPSRREVKSATIVVAVVTVVLGMSLYGFDWALQRVLHLFF